MIRAMANEDEDLYTISADLTLSSAPQGCEPSELEGVSRAELITMIDQIRWFSRLSAARRLAVANAYRRRVQKLGIVPDRDAG